MKTAARKRLRYSSLRIGRDLAVTEDEVYRFQLKSIYAATDTPEAIKQRKRDRDAEAQRSKRRAAGAQTDALRSFVANQIRASSGSIGTITSLQSLAAG